MTLKEIEQLFQEDKVLDGNNNLTQKGLRAVWTITTALKNGYCIQGKLNPMMGVEYEIWQLPPSSPYKFLSYEWLKGNKVDIKDYVRVYVGRMQLGKQSEMLDNIFELHNAINSIPSDYYGTSVSVSDIICLVDTNNKRDWYYVNGIGFTKLNWN